ncbi:DUF4326 domain-containing protein [Youhaiella tibetensis]|nr:DUF4326 domain-containing protein [Youhaiella tibetensis]
MGQPVFGPGHAGAVRAGRGCGPRQGGRVAPAVAGGNDRAGAVAGRAPTPDAVRADLAGRNLACWCSLDGPCHADTLLRIANL